MTHLVVLNHCNCIYNYSYYHFSKKKTHFTFGFSIQTQDVIFDQANYTRIIGISYLKYCCLLAYGFCEIDLVQKYPRMR